MNEKDRTWIVELCIERKALGAHYIKPESIKISEWVRYKCQYGCSDYGKCHSCPPNSPTPETTRKIVSDYTIGLLVHFDGDTSVTKAMVEIEREVFIRNYYKAISFGAGPCRVCKECASQKCNFPQKTRPSMEACGIDVFETARRNGFEIDVLKSKDEGENCYGLILIE